LIRKDALDIDTMVRALNVLGDGVAIYDAEMNPIFVNDTTIRRFRMMHEDLAAGLTYRQAQVKAVRRGMPDATDEQVEAVATDLYRKSTQGETYTVTTEDNRVVQITFQDMGGGLKAAISVDVTDHRKRERELDKARKEALKASEAKSAFLANMSHEIRTPLNGVLGMAQVLQGTGLDEMQTECVTTIIESGKALTTVLNDVLDLSKIEAGKFQITPAEVEVHDILKRTYRLWKPRAEEKNLELSLSLDFELPERLVFDGVRVQQCVSNLVSNAIKFTESGRIEIGVRPRNGPDGDMVEIIVRDTGPGMDAETLGRLFKPFAQADETISRKHGGTGLGLSITRRLAELMGGSASATSEVGRGSTFRITFRTTPVKAAAAPPAPANANAPAASPDDVRETIRLSKLHVLLTDDQPINRQVVRFFLRPFNMNITEAANGQEALDALGRETFDLVLLDMHMPVMDGPTTIANIRASGKPWAEIPVLALTADAMSGDRERYLAMGMSGYLSKPLAERDLLTEIGRLMHVQQTIEPLAKAG
jgi:signal transduction histidine kinase/ActR/RegA family two-component response regulator